MQRVRSLSFALISLPVLALALAALPGGRAGAEGGMSGDWAVTIDGLPTGGSLDCFAYAEQDVLISTFFVCAGGAGGGLLKGPFDKTEMTFEVSGYLPGGLFMEWSGVISQDGASFDGTWVVWQDTKQLGSGALSGERADFPWGDADCDGVSNSVDAQLVLQEVAGLSSLPECGLFADASFDGNRNAYDAALILQYEAGLLESLPVLPTETP